MKKLYSLMVLFAVLCFTGMTQAQNTLTVCNGTSYNDYVPFQGYNADGAQHNQMIYVADSLTDMIGKEITQMVFYIYSWGNGSGNQGDWTISLGVTQATTLNSLDNTTPLTQVYYGTMTYDDNHTTMTITFDNAFTYEGGNLLVDFDHTAAGWRTINFYGVSATSGASYTRGSKRSFLPKVTFSYQNPPACPKPSNLAANTVTATGATLSWQRNVNGAETAWVLQYGTDPTFADGTYTETAVNTNPTTTLSNLTTETVYYARVKADCGNDGQSDWSNVSSFWPTATTLVTFNDGTDTYNNIPFYAYGVSYSSNSYYGTPNQSQFILSADNLDGLTPGSTIKRMYFYGNSVSAQWGNATFSVYLKEVYEPTFASATFQSDYTTVYAGTLSMVNNVMEVVFDQDYIYHGGHLLVGVELTQKNIGPTASITWYGVNGTENSAVYRYRSYSSTEGPSISTFLPKVSFRILQAEETCQRPKNLSATAVNHEQATISWTSNDNAWELVWSNSGSFNPDQATAIPLTTKNYTIQGLSATTDYYVYVRTKCGDNNYSSWSPRLYFKTTEQVPSIGDGWTDNFEGSDCEWTLENGSCPNVWTWGTAANNGGEKALYISNDQGTTNAYTTGTYTIVYATRTFFFDSPKYTFQYDWRAKGESGYDYLRVALIPTTEQLSANTNNTLPSGFSTTSLPASWIAVDGGSKLNTIDTFQTVNKTVKVPAGVYKVALIWRNDNGGGTQPPAAVDNFSITRVPCPYDVENLAVAENPAPTQTTATLTWSDGGASQWQVAYATHENFGNMQTEMVQTAAANLVGLQASTKYYVKVRAFCGGDDYGEWSSVVNFHTACGVITVTENASYTCDFSESNPATNMPYCWSHAGSGTTECYTPYSQNYTSLQFKNPTTSGHVIAILPEFANMNTLRLGCQIKAGGNSEAYGTFDLGYMTDVTDTNSFVSLAHYAATDDEFYGNAFVEKKLLLASVPANARLAMRFVKDPQYATYQYPSWEVSDVVVEVAPSCLEPAATAVSALTNVGANLSWQPAGNETTWNLQYRKQGENNWIEVNDLTFTTCSLTVCDPNTTYEWRVQAKCSANDLSIWTDGDDFTTRCNPITIPYVYGFEDYESTNGYVPYCWNVLWSYSYYGNYPSVTTYAPNAYSGSKALSMFAHGNTPGGVNYTMISMPPVPEENPLNTLQVNFYAKKGSSGGSGSIVVGVIEYNHGSPVFVPVDTVGLGIEYEEKEVSFENYNGNGDEIAFKLTLTSNASSNSHYAYIDSITVQPIPPCKSVTDMWGNPSDHSVEMHWSPKEYAHPDSYVVRYGIVDDPDQYIGGGSATENTYNFTGLQSDSLYYFHVRAVCGTDNSEWETKSVRTQTGYCNYVSYLSAELTGEGTTTAKIYWTPDATENIANYDIVITDQYVANYDNLYTPGVSDMRTYIGYPDTVINVPNFTYDPNFTLSPNTTYFVYVRANCTLGDGSSYWQYTMFKTLSSCRVPLNPSFQLTGKRTAYAEWESGDVNQANNFSLILSETSLTEEQLANYNPYVTGITATSYNFTENDLQPNTTYYLYVANSCGGNNGMSPYVYAGHITTPSDCPMIQNLTSTQVTANTMTLTWNRDPWGEENLWVVQVMQNNTQVQLKTVDETTVTLFGLDPQTEYEVRVSALCNEQPLLQSQYTAITVTTTAAEGECEQVGNGALTTSYHFPISTYYHNSYTQQIYRASDLSQSSGLITSIAFNYFLTSTTTRKITVYIGNTELQNLSNGFISTSEMTQVLPAQEFTFSSTNSWCSIPLATPFDYTGGNIVVAVFMEYDACETQYSGTNRFYYTNSETASARYCYSDGTGANAISFTNGVPTASSYAVAYRPNIKFCFEQSSCPAVKNIQATNITSNGARVTWLPGSDETAWQYTYSVDPITDFSNVNWQTANDLRADLSGLTPGTLYNIYIKPNKPNDNTCAIASGTFTTEATCPVPSNLEVQYDGGTTATVTWTSQASSFNMIVNNEVINNVTSPYPLNNLTLATSYIVKVQAVCGEETSAWTSAATFTTDECLPTDMCNIHFVLNDSYGDGWSGSYIKVTDAATGEIIAQVYAQNHNLSSTATSDEEDLPVCNGRELAFSWVNGGSGWDSEASYVVTDANGQEIFSGSGAMSSSVSYTVSCSAPTVCNVPTGLYYTTVTAHEATVRWKAGGDETVWNLRYHIQGENDWDTETTQGDSTFTFTQLTGDAEYEWQVQAVCGTSTSDWSALGTFTTEPSCKQPTNIVISNITAHGAVATWQDPNNMAQPEFYYYCWNNANPTYTSVTVYDNTVELTGLTANTSYTFVVYARCSANESSYGSGRSFTTDSEPVCPAPTALRTVTVGTDNATVRWKAGGEEAAWNLKYHAQGENQWIEVSGLQDSTYTFSELTPATTYEWMVQAICGTTTSEWSATGTFTTSVLYTVTAESVSDLFGSVDGAAYWVFTEPAGTEITLTAIPAPGYEFTRWVKYPDTEMSTDAVYTFAVSEDARLIAYFSPKVYNISYVLNQGSWVTNYFAPETYTYSEGVTLPTVANVEYLNHTFEGWYDNAQFTGNPITVISTTAMGDTTLYAKWTIDTYDITLVQPANGTISSDPAQTAAVGAQVTLTATPNEGYSFDGTWEVRNTTNGQTVDVVNNQFTMPAGNVEVHATFTINEYAIAATANPAAGGTVTGANTYSYGAVATLTATANEGYSFVNWKEADTVVSTSATFAFEVKAARTFEAIFAANEYTITYMDGNTTLHTDTYVFGANVTPFADPTKECAEFTGWNETIPATMPANDIVLNAMWRDVYYNITVSADPTVGGTVTIMPEPVVGTTEATSGYVCGTQVTLTATANTGYTFSGWTANGQTVSTDAEYVFNATQSNNFVANFTAMGTVSTPTFTPAAGEYSEPIDVTIECATEGATIYYTTDNSEPTENSTLYTQGFTLSQNTTVKAIAVKSGSNMMPSGVATAAYTFNFPTYTVTLNPGNGTVGQASLEGNAYTQPVFLANIPATPNTACADWTFAGWSTTSVTETTTAPTFVPEPYYPTANTTLYAVYQKTTATNTESQVDFSTGSYSNNAITWTLQNVVTIKQEQNGAQATPNSSYVSAPRWYKDHKITITPAVNIDSITVTATSNSYATVLANSTYTNATASVSDTKVVIKPNTGTLPITIVMSNQSRPSSLVVSYSNGTTTTYSSNPDCPYHITVNGNISNGTIAADKDEALEGEAVTLTATPATGYHFGRWTVTKVNTPAVETVEVINNTFTMPASDVNVSADFWIDTLIILATANPTQGGTVTGEDEYEYGTQVTVTAIANNGYIFHNWTANGVEVSTDASFTFTATQDSDLIANFTAIQTVATPTFTPVAGTYTEPQTVTINCATEGATIYYTTDGNEPTESSTQYTAGITLNTNTTVKAIAVKDGAEWLPSEVATAAYTFNFPTYTVILNPGNGTVGQTSMTGNEYTEPVYLANIPATPNAACTDWTFAGWSTTEVTETTTAPTFVADPYYPTADITLYAVYQMSGQNTSPINTTASVDFSQQGYSNAQAISNVTIDNNVSAIFAQGSNTNNAPKYYTSGAAIRCYGGNTITVASANTITGITLTFGSGDGSIEINTVVGSYYETIQSLGIWTGSANSVEFTVGGTTGNRRIAGIEVTYQQIPTTYNSNPVCSYMVNVDGNVQNGTISADKTEAVPDETVTLTATPATGYHFGKWEVTKANTPAVETVDVTNNTFTMPASDVNVSAIFWIDTLTITVSADPTEGGSVTGAGEYEYNTQVTLTATANTGYTFTGWTVNGQTVSADAQLTFNVTKDSAFVATFTTNEYTITYMDGNTQLHVETLAYGANVPAYADPEKECFEFIGWNETIPATMPANNVVLYAQWNDIYYNVTVSADPNNGGTATITPDPVTGTTQANSGYVCNTQVTLTATANEGYTFTGWTVNGQTVSTDAQLTFNVTKDSTFVATFTTNEYTITYMDGNTQLHVETLAYGANVPAYADPEKECFEFIGWNETIPATMPANNVVLYAQWNDIYYNVTVSADPNNGGTVTITPDPVNGTTAANSGYVCNTQVTLTATANEGYTFTGWTVNGQTVSTDAQLTFNVTRDSAFVATFTINTYTITATANPTEGGNVTGGGTFDYGTQVTLTATPAANYLFTNWTSGGQQVSTEATFTFTATQDSTFVANFSAMETVAMPTFDPVGGNFVDQVTVSINCTTPDVTIYYTLDGTDPVVPARRNATGTQVYTDPITLTETTTIKAVAAKNDMINSQMATETYRVLPTRYVLGWNTVNGTVGYTPDHDTTGATIAVTATPAEGYHFAQWHVFDFNGNDVPVSNNEFIMPDTNVYVDAIFEPDTFDVTFVLNEGQFVNGYTPISRYWYQQQPALPTADDVKRDGYTFAGWYQNANLEGNSWTSIPDTAKHNLTYYAKWDVNSYDLTINYVDANGQTLAPAHMETLQYGAPYNVSTPDVATYMPDQTVVSGNMGTAAVTVDVIYTQIVMNTVDNQTVCAGGITTAVEFSLPAALTQTFPNMTVMYEKVIDITSIGIEDNGYGNIASFTAVNAGTEPVVATITVTPLCTLDNHAVRGVPQTFTITVNPKRTSEFSETVCDSYCWATADTTIVDEGTNDYVHVFTSQYGCDSTVTLHLTLYKTPTSMTKTVTPNTSCDETAPNGAITISAPTGDFQYSINGNDWQTTMGFAGLAAGNYTVYVRPFNSECAYTESVTLEDNIEMPVSTPSVSSTFYCLNSNITLDGAGSSTGADYTYAWTGPNNYSSSELSPVFEATDGNQSGTYVLTVTNTVTSCVTEASVDVVVNTPSTSDYLFTITAHGDAYANIDEGQTSVSPVFAAPVVNHYLNNTCTTVNDAAASYDAVGNYTITWTATDECGNIATTTQVLHVTQNVCPVATDVDNNTYPSVMLAGKCWMAKNLRTTKYSDNRPVTNLMVYENVMYPNTTENLDRYGYLYDWASAMDAPNGTVTFDANNNVQGICPANWHLPTGEDFMSIAGNNTPTDMYDLRYNNYWLDGGGSNSTNYSLLPGGCYNENTGRYENILGNAYLWGVNTTNPSQPRVYWADCKCYMWQVNDTTGGMGYSVRCIKD